MSQADTIELVEDEGFDELRRQGLESDGIGHARADLLVDGKP